MIPNDSESPMVTSGVRIGTTAMTIKGAKEMEMIEIANLINKVAENIGNQKLLDNIKKEVKILSNRFPLYNGEI